MNYSNDMVNPEIQSRSQRIMRDTYRLLGLNILSASALAGVAMMFNVPLMPWYVVLGVYMVTLFLLEKNADSSMGVFMSFIFTGWLGFTTGPIIQRYLAFPNGADTVTQALLGTAILFIGLSVYANMTKKNYSQWGGFLTVACLSAFIVGILNIMLFQSGILSLVLSTIFIFISGASILFYTSAVIHGGETNYVRVATGLFVTIYNIFMSLLNILGFVNRD